MADLNTNRRGLAGSGVSNTSALAFSGFGPGSSADTEQWNGSSWTEVNNVNQAATEHMGAGTTTDALMFGGFLGNHETEEFSPVDGTQTVDDA